MTEQQKKAATAHSKQPKSIVLSLLQPVLASCGRHDGGGGYMRLRACNWALAAVMALGLTALGMPLRAASGGESATVSAAGELAECITCLPRTKPKRLWFTPLEFPEYQRAVGGEGWVQLSFTVRADGSTGDIVVIDSVGSPDFQKRALEAAAKFEYKPATENGVAVETSVLYLFRFSNEFRRHKEITDAYGKAAALIQESHFEDAISVLNTSILSPKINLFEEAMLEHLLAYSYRRLGRINEAVSHARHATIYRAGYLSDQVKVEALLQLIEYELAAGNLIEARQALALLRANGTNPNSDDPLMMALAKAETMASGPSPIAASVTLVAPMPNSTLGQWSHRLIRRTFTFTDVKGAIDRARLSCEGRAVDIDILRDLQWTVQKGWGDCFLFASGTPGSTFRLIEAN